MDKDNVLNVLEESVQKRDRFLAAWKRGVEFLGADLFGPGRLETARNKDQLRPLRDPVEPVFAKESGGKERFLAAMVSFNIKIAEPAGKDLLPPSLTSGQ